MARFGIKRTVKLGHIVRKLSRVINESGEPLAEPQVSRAKFVFKDDEPKAGVLVKDLRNGQRVWFDDQWIGKVTEVEFFIDIDGTPRYKVRWVQDDDVSVRRRQSRILFRNMDGDDMLELA